MNGDLSNIVVKGKIVDFHSLTLKQKIAQMIVVRGDNLENLKSVGFNIGGVFLSRQESYRDYKTLVERYKRDAKIKLFVCTDLEGAWNPFKEFVEFPKFSDIKNEKEVYLVGLKQGEFLMKLGFNLNFSPVAEFIDKAYGGRVFLGGRGVIKAILRNYIRGLQKNVLGCCKHYPGKGLFKDTHRNRDKQEIFKDDLELFETCFRGGVSSVMIGHQSVEGEIDSKGRPSSVSPEVIHRLRGSKFKGLVVSDEIGMFGLKSFYFFNKRKLYRDLINAGEEVILDFDRSLKSLYKIICMVEKDVRQGKIDGRIIDKSVRKILKVKGYVVK